MSDPGAKVRIQLFESAVAQPVDAPVLAIEPDMGQETGEVEAPVMTSNGTVESGTATVIHTQPPSSTPIVAVPILPVVFWGCVWVLTIIAMAQAIKRVLKVFGLKERLGRISWRRWCFVFPIISGQVLSVYYGNLVASQFGVEVSTEAAILFMGPVSAMGATFCYNMFREVVLPILPDVIVEFIEKKFDITVPEDKKEKLRDLPMTADSVGIETMRTESTPTLEMDSDSEVFEDA